MNLPFSSSSRSPRGLTLIELLLAIAIAALLVGVVFLVYVTTLNTLQNQTVWHDTMAPAVAALDVMKRDLMCSLIPFGLTNPPFVLNSEHPCPSNPLSLHFFTALAGEGSNGWRSYGIQQVHYSLRSAGATGVYSLIRHGRPFRISTTAPYPREELLVKNLNGMQVQVFNGSEWTNQWGHGTTAGLPQAARMTLHLGPASRGIRTITSETLIPVGHRIKAPPQTGKTSDKPSSSWLQ